MESSRRVVLEAALRLISFGWGMHNRCTSRSDAMGRGRPLYTATIDPKTRPAMNRKHTKMTAYQRLKKISML